MSKEAEEFYRKRSMELAKTPNMKRFLKLVNFEKQGKIMQEYATEQLKLCEASHQRELLIGYIFNEQKLYCGKPDRKLSEELADDYIANL